MNNLKLIWIGLLTLFAVESSASHVLGGNITWQCLGGDQYQNTFNMYRDRFGQSAPLSQETVFLIPSGCGVLPFSVNLSLTSTTEVSELCPIELANSSCNGGILPGAQQLVYSGTVTLDPGCAWEVTWNGGDWNYMNNINFSTFPDAVISSEINPAAGCLSSIQVTSAPIPYECRNIGQICNQLTVSGAGGYTLTYAAVTPQTLADSSEPLGPTINVPGYAPISGLTVSAAGNVCFNSNGLFVGNYVATIQISIFQGAIPVGTIFHNMTFVIRDCVTTPTTFVPDGVSSLTGGTLVNATTIDVCVGDPLCFSVSASNTNPFRTVNITAAWPPALNAGAPAFTSGGTTNPRVGTFCMATTPAMIGGPYIIEFDATDDACVLPGFDQLSITINIYPALTLSVTDTMVCVGQSLPISASGGTTYTWTPLSGAPAGLSGNGANQTITNLQQDASIEVLLNGVPAQCASRDTVNVEVALSALSTVVTQETCVQNDGDIDLTVTGGSGNYTYSWSPGGASSQDL
ncbi:MAG: SprB repeat-containing protein, partial [Bacteroidota bacterium]